MNANGFSLLRTLSLDEQQNMESLHHLPPIFKIFSSIFILGHNSIRNEYYFDSKENYYFPIFSIYFDDGISYVSIQDFIGLNEISEASPISYLEKKMIKIANSNDGGGVQIFLGYDSVGSDEIYKASWDSWDEEGKLIKLADNIFEFVKNLKSIKLLDTPNNLYRNWGEDFWRVREE